MLEDKVLIVNKKYIFVHWETDIAILPHITYKKKGAARTKLESSKNKRPKMAYQTT